MAIAVLTLSAAGGIPGSYRQPMGRNYSQPTIKTLFAEASRCAYPGCPTPLVFHDRGAATAIADIAHIRSESPNGPRHDPSFHGDLNSHENLLLLCGQHHRPIDRHESLYTVDELLEWKATQVAVAGAGTQISDADARSYSRLTDSERDSLAQVARLAERLKIVAETAAERFASIRSGYEQERAQMVSRMGPVYEIDNDDARSSTPIPASQYRMPAIEEERWRTRLSEEAGQRASEAETVIGELRESLAVLRMQSPGLTEHIDAVAAAATACASAVADASSERVSRDLDATVRSLWEVANGERDRATG
ncbi:HNH endonuclease signature motif containing protein [Pseudactinotalea suaedae]|uniref:HNH endonuclease signature motif containing protein n=1 Tax=Pseudactinotalea suaedae TaxID=1524924 RepID=UPI0012E13DB6|nr:HNH endonuclease signature motif containing protein [Pseudactinotalea suaedae]